MSVVRATAVPVPVAGVHTRRIQRRTGRDVVWRGVWTFLECGDRTSTASQRSSVVLRIIKRFTLFSYYLLVRYYAVSTVVD